MPPQPLPYELWSHILSFCVEQPDIDGYIDTHTLANALRVSSTLFLAAAPHLYLRPAVAKDPYSFVLGANHDTAVYPSSFWSTEQIDYEYLRWGHKKAPLLRHLRQVTFFSVYSSGFTDTAAPDPYAHIIASIGEANAILADILHKCSDRIAPKFETLCLRDPYELPPYHIPIPAYQHFVQLFTRAFRPTLLCMDTVDPTFSPNLNNCEGYTLPELVVIHCDLDWKLNGVWGTRNRVCLVDSKARAGLEQLVESTGNLDLGGEDSEGGHEGDVATTMGPVSWEDIGTEQGQDFQTASLEVSHHSHTSHYAPPAAPPVAADELYLVAFDPEDFDEDDGGYPEDDYTWSDDEGAYDDGLDYLHEEANTALRESRHAEGRYTEDDVVYMLKDFLKRASQGCNRNDKKKRNASAAKTSFEIFGLRTFMTTKWLEIGDHEWAPEDTEEVIWERGLKRIRDSVLDYLETELRIHRREELLVLRMEEVPVCEACGRGPRVKSRMDDDDC
ncbi:hypothetical protein L198_01657 [Cryptococcus wingfieldii CBS 7118]|uniref:Uncharacterized protein n=1 Tax=Cryptococcus wingfieldii CBS 7118 TaxID=1295528 RepID=A0A1E3K044_9TREE|nr:hypothetical protein L198_01657 [Cryptococcus wingfieldii CBS 7118]ODO06425.1 hypothetical protein L198_01657 [Cryptococcus wingfieldii CBS 7118]